MKRFIFFVLFFVLLISTPSFLQAQEQEVTLGQVVVTGTRDVQEIRKIPANVTVITRGEAADGKAPAGHSTNFAKL